MEKEDKDFLSWLSNRLVYKHGYSDNDAVVTRLLSLASQEDHNSLNIQDQELDLIISKYYVDFFLDKADDFRVGYTNLEREELRNHIRSLVIDINNKNIPSSIIK